MVAPINQQPSIWSSSASCDNYQRKQAGPRPGPGEPFDKLLKSSLLCTELLIGESRMFRCFKALSLTLALVGSIIFLGSCSSNTPAQARVFNAIPDGSEVDVEVNGQKDFTQLKFTDLSPTTNPPATYTSVPSGSVTFEAFLTGTTTSAPPESTFSLNASTQYTVILEGFNNEEEGNGAPTAVPYTDNNTAPASANVEFRIINASPSSPGGSVDVYIEPGPYTGTLPATPTIAGLVYTQASAYQPVPVNTGGGGFDVIITAAGNQQQLIHQNYNPSGSATTGGTITTLVLVDVSGGGQMSPSPIEINDLD
jgi:hypothetical protein